MPRVNLGPVVFRLWGGDVTSFSVGLVFAAGTAAQHTAALLSCLSLGEELIQWGCSFMGQGNTCAKYFLPKKICVVFTVNYLYMKQDVVPDLKSYQTRKGVKAGCLEVQPGEQKGGGDSGDQGSAHLCNKMWWIGARVWRYEGHVALGEGDPAGPECPPEMPSGRALVGPHLVLILTI